MKQILSYLLMLLILTGCGVCRHPIREEVHVKDSLVLQVKDSVAIKYVPVEVEIPVEVMREIIPSSDSSHLETGLATSEAFIDSTGHLHHTLANKAGQTLHVDVPVEEHWHSEQEQDTHSEQQTIIQEVERELTWWQKFWINSGKICWLLVIGGLLGLLLRLFIFKK